MSTQINRKEIKYSRTVQSQAMRKMPNQDGLILSTGQEQWSASAGGRVEVDNDILSINSLNPRTGETTYLEMQIPIENIDDLIKALYEIKQLKGI